MTVDQINNYEEQALSNVITQYKDKPNLEGIITTYAQQVQDLENAYFQIINETSLETSSGAQLDQMGTILNSPRNGLEDDAYKSKLIAKVAENTSEGTPKDLINIFKILMQAESIQYDEVYPATVNMTAFKANAIVSSQEVRTALENAKAAGVQLGEIKNVLFEPEFCFFQDPDPDDCKGFRDFNIAEDTLQPFILDDALSPSPDPNTGFGIGELSAFVYTTTSETLDPNAGHLATII